MPVGPKDDTRSAGDLILGDPGWFSGLIDEAVTRQRLAADPVVAPPGRRARLTEPSLEALWATGALVGTPFDRQAAPVTGRSDPEAAFIELLRFQLAHVGALWRAHGPQGSDAARMRWFVGGIVGAMSGEIATAAVLDEAAWGQSPALGEREERRLFGIVGSRLLRRAYLLGHPPAGLPLHAGLGVLDTRAALRLASGRLLGKGPLRPRATRVVALLSRTKALWIELLAGLPGLLEADPADLRRALERQVRASALATSDRRALLRTLDTPRHPARILRPNPPAARRLLVEQTILAAVLHRRWKGPLETLVRDAAGAVDVPATFVEAAQARSAAFVVQHASAAGRLLTSHQGGGFEDTVVAASDTLRSVATAIAQELKETGDLGVLLARMAQGENLTRDEKTRVRAQLADLARIVPALAIFAAPGGMLLLPAVLKLLPFDLRPSAFRSRRTGEPPEAA